MLTDFGIKFRLIVIPFLAINIACILGYSLVHWWLLIRHEVFVIDENVVNFFGSLGIVLIALLIWLFPRLKLLNFTTKKIRNPLVGCFLIAYAAVAVPTIIAQEYLITATGTLTELDFIEQIGQFPKTKYYTLKNAYVDKQQARPYTLINTSGKNNVNYNMALYMACPLVDAKLTQSAKEPLAWLGINYQKTIRNSASGAAKTREFQDFIKQSEADFDRRDLTSFSYLDRIGPCRQLTHFSDAVTFSGVNNIPFVILVPHWGRFEDRNGDKALWLLASLIIGALLFTGIVAAVPLKAGVANDGDDKNDKYVFESYKLER